MNTYYIYILTNATRSTLYIGITNDLGRRMMEHREAAIDETGFTGKYKCHYLIYFEEYQDVKEAIQREKEIKKWSRKKKEALIDKLNPEWKFLEDGFL